MNEAAGRRSGLHQAYVATVVLLGLGALLGALYDLQSGQLPIAWIALGVATLAAGAFTIKVPASNAAFSISETFLFIAVLYFGAAPAIVIVALDALTISLIRRRREFRHAAFNLGEACLSMAVAAKAYEVVSGIGPLWQGPHRSIGEVGVPALILCGVYFLLNTGLNALAVSTESGSSPLPVWRKFLLGVSANYFGGGSIAVLVAVNMRESNPLTNLLAIAPLIIVSYFMFKTSMGRLEDENRHLGEVNKLYLKVVETLAMAVDAKDQVTHGHIRRVQTYALTLAKAVGVTDPLDLRAIESAALLHDMGKLAIPEHILNKPGKLTPEEYELMKQHAPIGAEMLAAVDFPYPVVPVVRHHHENWDGTGYPDGLAGEAIPIGGRVLAVVDCYDALRSHRPYRRSLTPDQAMAIVLERRGTMYDPTVVDAFQAIQGEIESDNSGEPHPTILDKFSHAAHEVGGPSATTGVALPLEIRTSVTDTLLRLYQELSVLGPDAGVDETCSLVSRSLLGLAPASLVVFYQRIDAADEVAAVYASGFMEALVRDVRMKLGHGVSGWVAANGVSVINADCALDLGHRLDGVDPGLRSVLSVPLGQPRGALGVVTLYASQPGAFREEQRLALDLISGPMAVALERALGSGSATGGVRPSPTRQAEMLAALLDQDKRLVGERGRPLGILRVRNVGDASVDAHAAAAVSHATRITDLIFRPREDDFVVLMPDCDAAAGQVIVERLAAALPPGIVSPQVDGSPLRVAFACSPYDGDSLGRLLAVAERRLNLQPESKAERATSPVSMAPRSGGGAA